MAHGEVSGHAATEHFEPKSVLGRTEVASATHNSTQVEGLAGERSKICMAVSRYVQPLCESWGVRIVNFQLESTKIADEKYAQEYEEASLAMAKAKANLRAVTAENEILLNRARAKAQAVRIEAEGAQQAVLLGAEAAAKARTIEARARNEAGSMMTNDFARDYAAGQLSVEFASKLRASVLMVNGDSTIGKQMLAQPMINAVVGSHVTDAVAAANASSTTGGMARVAAPLGSLIGTSTRTADNKYNV